VWCFDWLKLIDRLKCLIEILDVIFGKSLIADTLNVLSPMTLSMILGLRLLGDNYLYQLCKKYLHWEDIRDMTM